MTFFDEDHCMIFGN